MTNIIALKELIKNINNYSDYYDLYMLKNSNFKENEVYILVNSEEALASNNSGLEYIFGIYILKDIIENLNQQKSSYSINDVLKAIQFYYENDSFIELE